MPLDSQIAPVTFTKGLDTKSARKLVVPGKWDTLINVSLAEDGSLKRRDGFEALLDGQAGNGLATHGNELLLLNGPDVSTVSETPTTPIAKVVAGQRPHVDVEKQEVVFNQVSRDQQDMAYGGGYACYVWRSYTAGGGTVTGINCSVVDMTSGAKLISNTVVVTSATAVSPRVVFDDGAFFIFYIDGTTLNCRVVQTSLPTQLGSAVALVTDADLSSKNFDACDFEDASFVNVTYMLSAPNANSVMGIGVIHTAGVPSVGAGPIAMMTAANVTTASIVSIACRSFGAGSSRLGIYLVHTAGGVLAAGLVGVIFSAGYTVATAGPTTISATVPPVNTACHCTATAVNTTTMQIFFDQQSSYLSVPATIRPLQAVTASTALAVTVNQILLRSATYDVAANRASGPQGPFIAGKAFTSGSSTFLPVCMLENYARLTLGTNTDTTSAQCSFYLLDTTNIITSVSGTWNVAAGALYGTLGLVDPTLGGAAPTVGTPCSTPALASGFGICLQERGRLQLTNGFNTTPVGLSHLTLTPRTETPPVRAELGESTYFAGGQLGNYDGQQVVQHGFPNFPEGISAVVSAPGGGTKLTVGVHSVVAVYEWTDGAGNRHQSAASLPVEVTVANATDQINVLIPTTQLPQSAGYDGNISTLEVVCYMTAASGVTYYRAITSFTTPVVNDVTVSSVAYVIGAVVMTDDRLTSNEALYMQPAQAGTTLPNFPPGPMHGIGVSQDRVWGFLSDEPYEYTYSQEPLPNTGLQFNPDNLGGTLPSTTGKGVLATKLDEKTILFARHGLYVVYGNGPTPSGGFNNFSEPQAIPSDVGCREARSVIAIPDGLMFKSDKGFYLLGRDLVVRHIGDGVARWDSYDVTSAVMMGDRQEVRFTSSSAECPTLVYSYDIKGPDGIGQWSTFFMGNALHPGTVLDAVWWPATERYVHLQPAAAVFPGLMQDTPGVYVDGAGTADPLQALIYARTGWLHVAALEGFQRVRWLYLTATAATAPTTDLAISVDFDDMYDLDADGAYSVTVPLASITFDNVAAIDLRHHLARQKCKSVAFAFLEGGGVAYTRVPLTGLQVMSLEVGIKRGVNKLPAAQTVG